jgi:hypothetical protein
MHQAVAPEAICNAVYRALETHFLKGAPLSRRSLAIQVQDIVCLLNPSEKAERHRQQVLTNTRFVAPWLSVLLENSWGC